MYICLCMTVKKTHLPTFLEYNVGFLQKGHRGWGGGKSYYLSFSPSMPPSIPGSIPFLLRGDFRTCIPSYPQIQSPPGAPWSLPAGTEDGHAPRLGISDAAPVRTAAQPRSRRLCFGVGVSYAGAYSCLTSDACLLQVRLSLQEAGAGSHLHSAAAFRCTQVKRSRAHISFFVKCLLTSQN